MKTIGNLRDKNYRLFRAHRVNLPVVVWWLLLLLLSLAMSTIHAEPIYHTIRRSFPGSDHSIQKCWECSSKNRCSWGGDAATAASPIDIPAWVYVLEKLWEVVLFFATTFEVLARGFALGFGLRMLRYQFFEAEATSAATERSVLMRSYRRKLIVSAVAGISLAAFLHGSSLFFPKRWREEWFALVGDDEYKANDITRESLPETSVPRVLHRYIFDRVVERFADGEGNLRCDAAGGVPEFSIDWWQYVWDRSETGLKYLWTTLEVLLRGFSLGLGARMLRFLFLGDDVKNKDDDDSQEVYFSSMIEDDLHALVDFLGHRLFVSAVSGLSVAAVVHGSSLFVPTQLRDQWLVHH